MKVQHIALFGGTGFVGRHLACQLVSLGHHVTIISRKPIKNSALEVLPTVKVLPADDFSQAALMQAMSGCSIAINLIGILNESGRDGTGFDYAHVELSKRIVMAAKAMGIRRYCHMSALGANPEGPSHYLRTKGEAENWVQSEACERFHVTVFKPSIIVGPGDSFFNRFATLLAMSPGIFFLPCDESQSAPIYVGDVVDVICHSLTDARTYEKSFELCGPKVYTLKDLVTYCAEVAGYSRIIMGLGQTLSRVAAGVLQCVPGKPLSVDNYLSATIPSVCSTPLPEYFHLKPKEIETIVPTYLGMNHRNCFFNQLRKSSGRQQPSSFERS